MGGPRREHVPAVHARALGRSRRDFAQLPEDKLLTGTTLSLLDSVLQIALARGDLDEARRVSRALRRARELGPTSRIAPATSAPRRRSPAPKVASRTLPRSASKRSRSRGTRSVSGARGSSRARSRRSRRPLVLGDRARGPESAARGDRGAEARSASSVPRGTGRSLPGAAGGVDEVADERFAAAAKPLPRARIPSSGSRSRCSSTASRPATRRCSPRHARSSSGWRRLHGSHASTRQRRSTQRSRRDLPEPARTRRDHPPDGLQAPLR